MDNKRPQNIDELDMALRGPNGRVKWWRHITMGIPYAVSNHYSEWTEDEITKWSWLRAVEWSAWPAFLAMGIGQFLLLFMRVWQAVLLVLIVNFIWSLLSRVFVSPKLANAGVWVNKLKWVTTPLVAIILLVQGHPITALVALAWPIIAMLLQLGVPKPVGVIQKEMLKKIGFQLREAEEQPVDRMPEHVSGKELAEYVTAYYDSALKAVRDAGQASPGILQHKLQVSYQVSCALLDKLEAEGVIGPADGAIPRPLLND